MAMGDTLLERGRNALAARCYRAAQAVCTDPLLRVCITSRQGLVRYEQPKSTVHLTIQQAIEKSFPGDAVFVGTTLAVWKKNNAFLDDSRFMELVRKHEVLLQQPNWNWNFMAPLWAVAQTRNIEGDYVELGVFKGHTTLFLAEYYGFETWPKRWFLYDTFAGIPDDQMNQGWEPLNQRTYVGTYSYEEVAERFTGYPNIEVIQGRAPEILEGSCPEKIAFLHLDLNSAVAEIAALEFVIERIVPGGVIVFDDYCWDISREQYRAEKAWFAARGLVILEMPTGQGLFIKT